MGYVNKGYLSGRVYNLRANDVGDDRVVNFAIQQYYKPQGGEGVTTFINLEAWGKDAKYIEKMFLKGGFAAIEYRVKVSKNKTTNYDEIRLVVTEYSVPPVFADDAPAPSGGGGEDAPY